MSFKSLRRDEVYRYGIVLYDKFGNRSSVRWIADIRVPNMYIPGFQTFDCKSILPKAQWPLISEHEYNDSVFDELTVNSIGI
nr:MAG TPA: stabilization protein [Caudoviricetes sp.]